MLYIFITLLLVVLYASRIQRPVIYSANSLVSSIALAYVFPLFLMHTGLLQSLIPMVRKGRIIKAAKHTVLKLRTDDTEFVVDVYTVGDSCVSNVVLAPGLHGCSESKYIVDVTNIFLKRGCKVFVCNARGIRNVLTTNKYSHFGFTGDLVTLTNYIIANYTRKIFYIGFSQGANIVTKFMGEFNHERVAGGVAICNPFNFHKLEEVVRGGSISNRIGHMAVIHTFKKHLCMVFENNELFNKEKGRLTDLHTCRDVTEMLIEVKIIDTKCINTFLTENSSENYIKQIDKPFLFISATDDPIIPEEIIPKDKILANEQLGLITLQGGHLGFTSIFMTSTLESILEQYTRQLKIIK